MSFPYSAYTSTDVVHSLSMGVCHHQPLFEMSTGVSVVCLLFAPDGPFIVREWPLRNFQCTSFLRGVGALDQMVRLINIHICVVEIFLWYPSS